MSATADKLDHMCRRCKEYVWCGKEKYFGVDCPERPPGQIVHKSVSIEERKKAPPVSEPRRQEVEKAMIEKAKQPPPNSIRFPKEVLDHFDAGTPGWQRRINLVLLEYARKNPKP